MFKRTIKLRIHNPLCKLKQFGNWIDLSVNGNYHFVGLRQTGVTQQIIPDFQKIMLGVSLRLPDWYRAEIKPRGSTFRKHGIIITNSIGEIEANFTEQWFCNCLGFQETTIPDGETLFQMQISLRPDAPIYMKLLELFRFGFKYKIVDLLVPERSGDGSTDKINYNTQNLLCT